MSNYRGHTAFNMAIGLPLIGLTQYFYAVASETLFALFCASFVYGTLFMSPDLDLAKNIRLLSLRGFLTLPFRSYSRFFRHRGLSHSIFFGTLTRLLWLALWGVAIVFVSAKFRPNPKPYVAFFKANQIYFYFAIAGLFLADMMHLLLDRITSKNR